MPSGPWGDRLKIHCKYDELADPRSLKDNPKNRNKHPSEQIERLAKLYEYHGIRHPIIVSALSGFIVAGHGRKQAAIKAGLQIVPVVYQEFESHEHEYAFLQADNAIALWAELDVAGVQIDALELSTDFNVDMLGVKDFDLNNEETKEEQIEKEILFSYKIEVECINEQNQNELSQELESRGFKVRVLI